MRTASHEAALAAAVLLYVPCLLLPFLLPSGGGGGGARLPLSFDVTSDGTHVTIAVGTPPKPMQFSLSGAECGIRVWGRNLPAESVSWVGSTTSASGFGYDFAVIGGARAFLPMRYAGDGGDAQGLIGLCPAAVETGWGLRQTYYVRCGRLVIGEVKSANDHDAAECGGARPMGLAANAENPWSVTGCVNGTARVQIDALFATTPSPWVDLSLHPPSACGSGAIEDEAEERTVSGQEDCSGVATYVDHDAGRAAAFTCTPCERHASAVATMLFVVTVIGTTWNSLVAMRSAARNPAVLRAVCAAVVAVGVCFFAANLWGSSAGTEFARSADVVHPLATDALFAVVVIGVGAVGRLLAESPTSNLGRISAELPLYAAFWYSSHCLDNFFARTLVAGGAAFACAVAISSCAMSSVFKSERWAWACCSLASLVNCGVVWLAILPSARAVFGDGVPIRMSAAALFFVFAAFSALLIAARRTLR